MNPLMPKTLTEIPKLIFQTWKTKQIPDKWVPSVESIKKYAKNYNYVLMTDDDNDAFIERNFPHYLNTFREFPYPIQRADFIRYAFLYINGGVYMDLDLVLIVDLDQIIADTVIDGSINDEVYLIRSGNTRNVFTNSFMMSKPKSTFWLDCMKKASESPPFWAFCKHIKIMVTTGPLMVNGIANQNTLKVKEINPKYSMCSVCNDKCVSKGFQSLEGGSWNSLDSRIFNFFNCNMKLVIVGLLILIVFLMMRRKKALPVELIPDQS